MNCQGVDPANTGESQEETKMENKDLKEVYKEMYTKGSSSWFSDGKEERELILKMGEPWEHPILEIGCGEGELGKMIWDKNREYLGIDYCEIAINKAKSRYPIIPFWVDNYHSRNYRKYDRIVMQGVLEHLDYPFDELKWNIENLLTEKGDVITSSPCFLNPRGLVWMTLNMMGAKMSKTDLDFIDPFDMKKFCNNEGYEMEWKTCDLDWACGDKMVEDLKQRIPLALKDGNVPLQMILPNRQEQLDEFIQWLDTYRFPTNYGATAVYKITKGGNK